MTVRPFHRPRLLSPSGLRFRLVLYIAVVAAVPVALIALFSFRAGSAGIRRHTELHLTSVATLKADEVRRRLSPLAQLARSMARQVPLRQEALELSRSTPGPDSPQPLTPRLLGYLERAARSDSRVRRLSLLAPDGRVIATSSLSVEGPPSPLPGLSLLDRARQGLAIELTPPTTGSREAVHLLVPLTEITETGAPYAYLALSASDMGLREAMTPDPGLGPHGAVYLVDGRGRVLAPYVPSLNAEAALKAADYQEATGIVYRNPEGRRVVGAYQPLDDMGWGVVVEIPEASAYSDIAQMRWAIAGASAAFFLLILAASVLVTRRVIKPLHALMVGARRFGQGFLDHRIQVQGDDEIASLARSFNQMAQDLKAVQERVVEAERAAALQAFAQRKAAQLEQLAQFGLMVATASSLQDLVQDTPDMVRHLTGAQLGAVVLLEEGGAQVQLMATTDHPDSTAVQGIMASRTLCDLLRAGQRVCYPDEEHPELADALGAIPGLRGLLAVPFHAESGQVTGAVMVANLSQGGPFSAEDQELVRIVAGYVSAAIQKIRKEHHLQESEARALQALEELRLAQEQLVQSQKMESIGRLAGGVAHDFNNLLTPILGYAQLGAAALPGNHKVRPYLEEIYQAAQRASHLTQQLLAFSRKQMVEPRVVDLNDLIEKMTGLLRRVIGEDVELVVCPSPDLWPVEMDPGQIEQVVMNLAVNARDAMPLGGRLTIETANVTVQHTPPGSRISPGEYVRLTVSDTGVGMDPEVQAHIFEPFFTTKGEAKGTGLGLATCYGIVKQANGFIQVQSAPGQGATFRIFLPRARKEAASAASDGRREEAPRGAETVLLVEDEPAVRHMAALTLRQLGYTVLEAEDGLQALELLRENASSPDLLITDVIMPHMGGRELAAEAKALRPHIRILYTSGYTDDAIAQHGVLRPDVNLLHKPFTPDQLARKVRQVLDSSLAAT